MACLFLAQNSPVVLNENFFKKTINMILDLLGCLIVENLRKIIRSDPEL